jgi:hypothetical protein
MSFQVCGGPIAGFLTINDGFLDLFDVKRMPTTPSSGEDTIINIHENWMTVSDEAIANFKTNYGILGKPIRPLYNANKEICFLVLTTQSINEHVLVFTNNECVCYRITSTGNIFGNSNTAKTDDVNDCEGCGICYNCDIEIY